MVVVMQAGASEEQIQNVIDRLVSLGFDIHRSTGVSQTVLGAVGVHPDFDPRDIELLAGVREVVRITQPYKLASRAFRPEGHDRRIAAWRAHRRPGSDGGGGALRGGIRRADWQLIAERVAQAARACCAEERSSRAVRRIRFRGWAKRACAGCARRRTNNGLLVVSEVMDPSQIDLMLPYVDMLQVGARNMQNYHLLRALGAVGKPVLLKRGMSATIEELLLSAEYIMSGGNYNVILCERGIRTFETYTRNTLDIAAIPVIKKLSHLPILADPSHGTGRRDKVPPMARAAVAAGADGLLLEVHNDPEHALSDGAQSLYFEQFEQLMAELRMIAPAVGRRIAE